MYDYEKIKTKLYIDNLEQTIKDAFDPIEPYLEFKVRKFCDNFGFCFTDVIRQIRSNKVLAANFIKDPSKQNFYENTARSFLQSMNFVGEVIKLPSGGNNALCIVNGEFKRKAEVEHIGINKSIDFQVSSKNKTIFIAHKYTNEAGGAQDNQYHDLLNFIDNANLYNGSDFYFFAMADGDYYQNIYETYNDQKIRKIDILKQVSNKKRCFACTINEFEELINKLD